MLPTKLIMIGIGGFIGSICRFLACEMVLNYGVFPNMGFPAATLMVNTIGCFLIGCLAGISHVQDIFSPHIRLLLFVGFLGGFTTFSTFGYELFTMVRSDEMINALLCAGMHIVLGLSAVGMGFYLPTFFL